MSHMNRHFLSKANPPIFTALEQARDPNAGDSWFSTLNNVLLANPAAVNDIDKHGRPLLHVLSLDVVQGRIEETKGKNILECLVRSGVNLAATSRSGATAYELARGHSNPQTGEAYLKNLEELSGIKPAVAQAAAQSRTNPEPAANAVIPSGAKPA